MLVAAAQMEVQNQQMEHEVVSTVTEMLTRRELEEVKRHKYFMSESRGYDVGYEAACSDWLANHAAEFRQQEQSRMLDMQREEIARHKWIESEKANCDLGRAAALDWVLKYAAQWRAWYNATYLR